MTEELNFKEICNLTTRTLGMPEGALSLKSRKRPLQIARSVAAYIGLTEENIHRTVIAKELNRDRSLMYHYENKHKHIYRSCEKYRNTFNKVYKVYKDIDNEKEIFIRGDHMKRHLLKSGVTQVKNPDVFIEVKSGEARCTLNTSYFKFSEQVEIVKFAMEKYHYTIKII